MSVGLSLTLSGEGSMQDEEVGGTIFMAGLLCNLVYAVSAERLVGEF